jgi:hypothetical protein
MVVLLGWEGALAPPGLVPQWLIGAAIVTDIDDIVKKVRFHEWQQTTQGERLVQKELRRTLLKYKLHTDQALFDKAYGYIRQYY